MAGFPWDAIIKLIIWLIDKMGTSRSGAIGFAAGKFGVPEAMIEQELKKRGK